MLLPLFRLQYCKVVPKIHVVLTDLSIRILGRPSTNFQEDRENHHLCLLSCTINKCNARSFQIYWHDLKFTSRQGAHKELEQRSIEY